MKSQPGYCWLTNRVENLLDMQHFTRSIKSIQCFRLFMSALLPNDKFCTEQFEKYREIYTNSLKDDWRSYNFNILAPNKTVKIQKSLSQDLTRTVGKHRADHQLPNDKSVHVDAVLQWLSQMLVFIDKRSVRYMQGYCDLLLPIFHVCFQGLLAINDSLDFVLMPSQLYISESFPVIPKNSYDSIAITSCALSSFAFLGLMESSLHHSDQFPPKKFVDQSMEILFQRLKLRHEFTALLSVEDNHPSSFAMKWLLLLFTQDLHFSDTLELWYELMKTDGVFGQGSFLDRVIRSCECASIVVYKNAGEKVNVHFLEAMQSTQTLTFADIKKAALCK